MNTLNLQFRITLKNNDLATRIQRYTNAFCFAEAASEAYLMKNNRNAEGLTGWWRIQSIEQVEPYNHDVKEDEDVTI